MNIPLSTKEIEALLSICWMASHADGTRIDSERAEIKRLTSTLTPDEIRHDLLYTDVVTGLKTLEQCTVELKTPAMRESAFEMAASVCFADKEISKKERSFLDDLRQALPLEVAVAEAIERNVKGVVAPTAPAPVAPAASVASLPGGTPSVPAATLPSPGFKPVSFPPSPAVVNPAAGGPVLAPAAILFPAAGAAKPLFTPVNAPVGPKPPTAAELDEAIRKAAILAGALELSPDPMCAIGVSPVQKRIVSRMGKMLGRELDRAQVAELMSATGVSSPVVTPQAEAATGYLGKLFGSLMKKAPEAPVKPKVAFAQTYALGQVAKRHVATGLTWSPVELKEVFQNLLAEATTLQVQALGEIQQRSQGLNARQVSELVEAV